ncbi:MAG: T9SS type A sorting domain-containing protein [Chitinophagales bacterium]
MKSIVSCLLVSLLWHIGYNQYTFVKQWDKRYGGTKDEGNPVLLHTTDGGYLVGGYSLSDISGDKTENNRNNALTTEDFWVVKLDATGNKLWDKRFGTSGGDNLRAVIPTNDGSYLLGGSSDGGAGGDKTQSTQGNADYWIVKIDSHGNKLWDKRYGGSGADGFYCMQQTTDGGYILGGASVSGISGDKTQENWDLSHFYADIWIVKIDSAGNKLWDKRLGGTDDDYALDIKQTKDGGYIIGGMSYSRIGGDKTQDNFDTLNPLTSDVWIVKIDSIGNKQWDKTLGTPYNDKMDYVEELSDGGYMLAGGGFKIIKTDSLGNQTWEQYFDGGAYFSSFSITNDKGYLFGGYTSQNIVGDKTESNLGYQQSWIVKADSSGNKQWDKTIFTNSILHNDWDGFVVQSNDGCYLVANTSEADIGGYKSQAAWDSSLDFFVVKFCMDTVTSINELSNQPQISVYPNPFNSEVSISLQKENLHQATFTITNSLGQIIYQRAENNLSQGYTKMLDLRYLPKGLYFITVEADGERVVRRVVKE